MPIPPFDANLVLPPHLGNPAASAADLSPYPATMVELCTHFGTSNERKAILKGLLDLRATLRGHGMVEGFQWIGGSFVEQVEVLRSRPPEDVDVVTYFWHHDPDFSSNMASAFPDFINRAKIKADYHVDHMPVDAGYSPEVTIENTRYWCGLFSHTRTGVWKGMLRVELDTPAEDADALALLSAGSNAGGTP